MGEVRLGLRRFAQATASHVADHAYYRVLDRVVTEGSQPSADWILAGEKLCGGPFVDHDNRKAAGAILIGDPAAAQHVHPHCLKVFRRHDAYANGGLLPLERASLQLKAAPKTSGAPDWKVMDPSG
jgi:hypothetical protein